MLFTSKRDPTCHSRPSVAPCAGIGDLNAGHHAGASATPSGAVLAAVIGTNRILPRQWRAAVLVDSRLQLWPPS